MKKVRPIYNTIEEVYDAIGGLKVRMYKNLRNGMWSIKYEGIVIGYAKEIALSNAIYLVSKAGRVRVLKEQCKNVHAYVEGYVALYPKGKLECIEVSYNPYKYGYFYRKDNSEEINVSEYAILTNKLFSIGGE